MTDQPIVKVENLTKWFTVYEQSYRAGVLKKTFFETLTDILLMRRNRVGHNTRFVALDNVNFTIKRGENVAIIGRNGSGKTTLLRLLSNMAEPSLGTAEVLGNFGVLFALNSGFNMQLSGRKNVYLLCALHGIYPRETDKIVDQIIDFSELGDFIDQPVKKYSNGMRARLGFSILIHVLPEVIFIDEALSTGDIGFRQKCLDRFQQYRSEKDRTLILVSHTMEQVAKLCERVIWLHAGKLVQDGPAKEVIQAYKEVMNVKQ